MQQIRINPISVLPFAALAGFNSEWAINMFNRIGRSFGENNKHPNEE